MALHEVVQAPVIMVQQIVCEVPGPPFQENVLVHLVVARLEPAGFELLVLAQLVSKQAEIPAWVPAVPEPADQEDDAPVDVIADTFIGAVHGSANLQGEVWRDA